ncbi:HEWD family protein [Halovenus rubra]|uniref:HEWD family protein n=2 Tax=Halovenus rubra TaxID=869890 RepID=A0ACC7E2R6_9EURY|nr:HEWD family protein [Halovenus rubra]
MTTIDPPRERRCLRCDRIEVWDDKQQTWVTDEQEHTSPRGTPHCVHEWNITGNYYPIENDL